MAYTGYEAIGAGGGPPDAGAIGGIGAQGGGEATVTTATIALNAGIISGGGGGGGGSSGSSVSEVLMKPGSWSLQLVADTPKSILNALDWNQTTTAGFGHIYLFVAPLKSTQFSDATARSLALYAGVLRERPTETSFGGPGLVSWLGDEDDKGDILETAVTQTAATLQTWVNALRPSSLSAGTSLASGSYTGSYQWVTRRKALDAVCAALGYEYRVNPNHTLDANTVATLYGSAPTGFVTRRTEERNTYTGILADRLNTALDLNDYTTKVRAITKAGLGTASGAATPYKDVNGNSVVITRVIEAPEAEDANAAATALVNRFSAQRKAVTLSTSTYALHGNVKVGESVYVYDPRSGLVDTANQIQFGGQLLFPVSMRVYGLSYPVRKGMGVAFRNGLGVWTDLTDWVQWGTGSTTIDVGGYARTLAGDPSYSGSAAISPAVTTGAWTAWTPTLAQGASTNISKTVTYARYRLIGSTCHYAFRVDATAAGTAGSAITVSLPFTTAAAAGNAAVGAGYYYDASDATPFYQGVALNFSSTTVGMLTNRTTTYFGANPAVTVASGDVYQASGSYEVVVT